MKIKMYAPLMAMVAAGIVAAAVLAMMAGCSKNGAGQARTEMPPAYVTVAKVQVRDVPVEINSFGTAEPFATIAVKNQIGGILTGAHFDEGQFVEANALLFTIDPRPYEAALAKAQASLSRDQVQLENASREAKRFADLIQKKAATEDEYDTAKSVADSLAAAVRGDEAAVVQAQVDLSYCKIYSPVEGVTGKLLINRGNVVKSYDASLVTINQVKPTYVTFTVPQQHLSELRKYQAAGPLEVDATLPGSGQVEKGTLTFIDNSVDVTTGTIRLKATFANEHQRLWPGQYVDTVMRLTKIAGAKMVPTQAIQTGQQGQYVFVLDGNNVASMQPIQTGDTYGNETVITQGLAGGETVVIDGQLRLAPGIKATIKNAASGPAGNAPARAAGSEGVLPSPAASPAAVSQPMTGAQRS